MRISDLPWKKTLNVIMVLLVLAVAYYAIHPAWLDLIAALLIAAILSIVLWLHDSPSNQRILTGLALFVFTGLALFVLFGTWYVFHPTWLSLISALLLALLIIILFYGQRRPNLIEPDGYNVEAWDTERQKLILEAWKQTVAVQMHFNDLELRIRNYAMTLLLAAGGAASISLKEEIYFRIPGQQIQRHISILLLIFGLFGWLGFYLMDRFWYHRLLYGAVRHGQYIEEKFGDDLRFLRLTKAIGDESSIWFLGIRIRSPRKIDAFYGLFALLLLAAVYILYDVKTKPL